MKLDVIRAIVAFIPACGGLVLYLTWGENWTIGATILGVGAVGVLALRTVRNMRLDDSYGK